MSIVTINVSQSVAPAPVLLQKTGAIISQGATTLSNNASALLNQASSLTGLLAPPLALSSLVFSGGTVIATTSASLAGVNTGDTFPATIAGASPSGYNGLYLATVTGANTFTYALANDPGVETVPGTFTPPGQMELVSQVNTFFGQGTGQAVYVLELGANDQTTGPAALSAWIATNPGVFYSYLVPRGWDASAGLLALAAQFENLNAKTYFFVTTTLANYASYLPTQKCIFALVESPNIPLTEFSLAAVFQLTLNYAPSATNRQTQTDYAYLYGVTQYPTMGNQATLAAINAANVSYVGNGAEGGISNTLVQGGTTLDGNDFSFWYSVDWIQLQCDQAIANAIINGANNPLNPLYYDQNGVNVLQDTVVKTVGNAITFGLATGTVTRATLDGPAFTAALDADDFVDQDVVNAVPFVTYTTENPSAYQEGSYGGLSVVYIPMRGFKQIIFNIQVTDFITQ